VINWEMLGFIRNLPEINLLEILQFFVILHFSVSFHECAHAWMADRCGDDTARLMGRLTLNPLAHIDIFGTVILPLIMILGSPIALIGWGKPVPVNPIRFTDYRKGQILTSIVGPISNLILMIIGALIIRILIILASRGMEVGVFLDFFFSFTMLNMVLCIFNLIPIPPLDGSHILRQFLSGEVRAMYDQFLGRFGMFILLFLVMFGWLRPIFILGVLIVKKLIGL